MAVPHRRRPRLGLSHSRRLRLGRHPDRQILGRPTALQLHRTRLGPPPPHHPPGPPAPPRHITTTPATAPNLDLPIFIRHIDNVYELYWNGTKIGAYGK